MESFRMTIQDHIPTGTISNYVWQTALNKCFVYSHCDVTKVFIINEIFKWTVGKTIELQNKYSHDKLQLYIT